MRVVGCQNSLQSLGAAPITYSGKRDPFLFTDGLDVSGCREYSLRVGLSSKELPDCRWNPPRVRRCKPTEEHFDHLSIFLAPPALANNKN